VECPSLTFLGGQTALPNVGGVFILKDEKNRPVYRVRIPATQMIVGAGGTRPAKAAAHKPPLIQSRFGEIFWPDVI
jgi:hypothetical protein